MRKANNEVTVLLKEKTHAHRRVEQLERERDADRQRHLAAEEGLSLELDAERKKLATAVPIERVRALVMGWQMEAARRLREAIGDDQVLTADLYECAEQLEALLPPNGKGEGEG